MWSLLPVAHEHGLQGKPVTAEASPRSVPPVKLTAAGDAEGHAPVPPGFVQSGEGRCHVLSVAEEPHTVLSCDFPCDGVAPPWFLSPLPSSPPQQYREGSSYELRTGQGVR